MSYHESSFRGIRWEVDQNTVHKNNIEEVLRKLELSPDYSHDIGLTMETLNDAAASVVQSHGAPSQMMISPTTLEAFNKIQK